MPAEAVALARSGWPIFPVHHPVRDRCSCRDPSCGSVAKHPDAGLVPHGHLQATTDLYTVEQWWRCRPLANIGARVPDHLVVLDVDPRAGGDNSLTELEDAYGTLRATLTSITGSGGRHLFWRHPGGPVEQSAHRLGPGLDVKVGGRGYVVLPPSCHASGHRYRWRRPLMAPAPMPGWMAAMLRPPERPPAPRRASGGRAGARPGDELEARLSWAEILEPAGWRLCRTRGEIDYWTRPGKRRGVSATVNATGTGRLHVFSGSAEPFRAGESYSKFAAWALLEGYGDDFTAAARDLAHQGWDATA